MNPSFAKYRNIFISHKYAQINNILFVYFEIKKINDEVWLNPNNLLSNAMQIIPPIK